MLLPRDVLEIVAARLREDVSFVYTREDYTCNMRAVLGLGQPQRAGAGTVVNAGAAAEKFGVTAQYLLSPYADDDAAEGVSLAEARRKVRLAHGCSSAEWKVHMLTSMMGLARTRVCHKLMHAVVSVFLPSDGGDAEPDWKRVTCNRDLGGATSKVRILVHELGSPGIRDHPRVRNMTRGEAVRIVEQYVANPACCVDSLRFALAPDPASQLAMIGGILPAGVHHRLGERMSRGRPSARLPTRMWKRAVSLATVPWHDDMVDMALRFLLLRGGEDVGELKAHAESLWTWRMEAMGIPEHIRRFVIDACEARTVETHVRSLAVIVHHGLQPSLFSCIPGMIAVVDVCLAGGGSGGAGGSMMDLPYKWIPRCWQMMDLADVTDEAARAIGGVLRAFRDLQNALGQHGLDVRGDSPTSRMFVTMAERDNGRPTLEQAVDAVVESDFLHRSKMYSRAMRACKSVWPDRRTRMRWCKRAAVHECLSNRVSVPECISRKYTLEGTQYGYDRVRRALMSVEPQ